MGKRDIDEAAWDRYRQVITSSSTVYAYSCAVASIESLTVGLLEELPPAKPKKNLFRKKINKLFNLYR